MTEETKINPPAPFMRATHNVRRIWSAGYEEIPCYCAAEMDHFIGREVAHAEGNGNGY